MKMCHKNVGSKYRERFADAQEVIKEQITALEKLGLKLKGLTTLYYINFNRPERDNINDVSFDDIINISKCDK